MKQGCYVTNPKTPNLGTGKVTRNDGKYITVYFGSVDEDREYSVVSNPLVIATAPPDNATPSHTKSERPASGGVGAKSSLESRTSRDTGNARNAQIYAKTALQHVAFIHESPEITRGSMEDIRQREAEAKKRHDSLRAISANPFHVMVEVATETGTHSGSTERKQQLFYGNEHTRANLILGSDSSSVNILAWTHPGVQLALSRELDEEIDIRAKGLKLKAITPLARAKFFQVLPAVAGLYEPGGPVGEKEQAKGTTGLKAVKLEMTKGQVDAFLSKMDGMMLVSGAPGSGKTTVAMQRIRFLFDQQDLRENTSGNAGGVRYSTELTKIFLANENLIAYSKDMLEKDLQIPSSVVESVDVFIGRYVNDLWAFKHNATLRRKKLFPLEERARQAFFGLCSVSELQNCWQVFETQIAERLGQAEKASWVELTLNKANSLPPQQELPLNQVDSLPPQQEWSPSEDEPWVELPQGGEVREAALKLASALKAYSSSRVGRTPLGSNLAMDKVHASVNRGYNFLRGLIQGEGGLDKFDAEFQKWLFWVYDPLDAIKTYFSEEMYAGGVRIKKGTATRVDENAILEDIRKDWADRSYGKEELPWLAFLLRFTLPVENDHFARFREMPNPLTIAGGTGDQRWTHVMIDEAQDLCVPQAALLGSFVHPDGAFTISADFKQIVSPVWGMESPEAFKVGISLRDKGVYQTFPFAKNMRQSQQIGLFLQAFYQSIFGEIASFEVNDAVTGPKPLLYLCNSSEFAARIVQRINVLRRRKPAIGSIALLQVNEDETAMLQIRGNLEALGVELAPIWAAADSEGRLITTSVERIKGLEFDACFVIGMDEVENRNLNYTKNRAYVALSRPATHLAMFCNEIPRSLQKIEPGLMEVI